MFAMAKEDNNKLKRHRRLGLEPPRRAATLLWWRGLRVLMTSKAMPDRVSHTGQARSEGPDEEQHKEGLSV
ncbi:unnamed protein product, partial [Iphiclides podalirius]